MINLFIIKLFAVIILLEEMPFINKKINFNKQSENLIWAATWDDPGISLNHVFPMVWLRWPMDSTIGNYQGFFPLTPTPTTDTIKRKLLSLPEGRRTLFLWHFGKFTSIPFDNVKLASGQESNQTSPWANALVPAANFEITSLFRTLKNNNINIDLLILDNEMYSFDIWNILNDKNINGFQNLYNDSRAKKQFFNTAPLVDLLDGVNLERLRGPADGTDYLVWNCALNKIFTSALNEAIWKPAKNIYPNLRSSNYDSFKSNLNDAAPNVNGHPQHHDNIFGTGNSPACYGCLEQTATAWGINPLDTTQLIFQGTNKLKRNAWNSLLIDIQLLRSIRRSGQIELYPWISTPSYVGSQPGKKIEAPFCGYPSDPRYYKEMVRHLTLTGSKIFLVWNPPSNTLDLRVEHAKDLNDILLEMNSKFGGYVSEPLNISRISYKANFIASGALSSSGDYLWRITVMPEVKSLIIEGVPAPLQIPQNEIGIWLKTKTRTLPKITGI
ncbi:MAG: hypothetical protein HQ491_03755 [Bacteroidetes bacterium]|nr:hypothetical protein [Bacteroidota bacterium]